MLWIKALLAMASLFLLTSCGDKDRSPTVSVVEETEEVITAEANHKGWDLRQIVTLDSVRALPVGEPMWIRTAWAGDLIEDFEVKLVGVVDDFMPPISLIMLEVVDERMIQLGGAPHGWSGSPIITKYGIVGALSYAFDGQNHSPYYFFATPVESMMTGIFPPGILPLGKLAKIQGRTVVPLAIPIVGSGVSRQLVEEGIRRGYNRSNILSLESLSSAGITKEEGGQDFFPGSRLTVAVVTGEEVIIGASGTTTLVSPYGQIIGFGHPFSNTGETGGWPIIGTRTLAQVSSLSAPSIFASLVNKVYGAIYFDRFLGIGGNLGIIPAMIPLKLNLTLPDGQIVMLDHAIVGSGLELSEQGYLSSAALLSPVQNRLSERRGRSFRIGTRMSFKNSNQEVNNQRLYADEEYEPAFYQALYNYMDIWYAMSETQSGVKPKNIELTIEVVDSLLAGKITHLMADTSFTAGTTLGVQVTLRVNKGLSPDRFETMEMVLPDSLKSGVYTLHVGSADDRDMADDPEHPGERVGLQTDTSATDEGKTWDEALDEINGEDQNTMLKARLILARPDIDSTAVTAPADTVLVPPLGKVVGGGGMEPPTPDTTPMIVPSATLQTGLVIEGHRMMEVRVVKK